ncbi:MAG: GspE/PulE family protein, partial [Nitrospiria bacterium]
MSPQRQKKKMLGEVLIEEGLLSQEKLNRALAEQKAHGGRIGVVLRNLGFITEDDIIHVLGKQMGIESVSLSNIIIDPEVVRSIPETLARRYQVIPLYKKEKVLRLAMVDPLNVFALDDIRRLARTEIEPVVSSETEIMKAIDRCYGLSGTMEEVVRSFEEQRTTPDRRGHPDRRKGDRRAADQYLIDPRGAEVGYGEEGRRLEAIAEDAPVVRLVNTVIAQAVREGASDIHIEPDEDVLRIRFRID